MERYHRIGKIKPFAFCGWLLLLYGIAIAQTKIGSVGFEGNSFFSQRQLLENIPSRPGQLLSTFPQYVSVLEELYRSEGFYAFAVDSSVFTYSDDSISADILIYITEHERTLISQLVLSGNTNFSSTQLIGLMESSVGSALQPSVLEEDIRSILDLYSRNGFPFTTVTSDSIRTEAGDPSQLIVQLMISEGSRLVMNEIRVEGNSVTSADVVAREVRMRSGMLFDQDRVEEIRKRLERLQLFTSVAEPQLYVLAGSVGDTLRGGLLITVTEGNTNTFDGIIGYVPPVPPTKEGYFTGNVFVAMRNLFGTGRKALIQWQRETELTQELELQYKEPWLFGVPLSIGGLLQQRKQDSSFVRTKAELRGEYAVTEALSVAGNLSTESVYPSSSVQQFSVFESNALSVGAEIVYDTRDNLRNPTGGVRYSTVIQRGNKEITGPEKYLHLAGERYSSVQKYTMDAEFYFTTFFRQVIMMGLHGKQISSSRLELSDLFSFGGTTTLRGYRENQFFASRIVYINTEYRFLTGRASSLFGFVDAGYFSRPSDVLHSTVRQERSLYGYGIGARIETGLGILNINYALGEGDSFSNGKIHVGIINEF
ncbi:MAG: BamA/TamA family outer membrane protein [Bacteroidetes bacterium]|nr:BamA/TamA family outer membrane protein [Bacteroidota bacterium]